MTARMDPPSRMSGPGTPTRDRNSLRPTVSVKARTCLPNGRISVDVATLNRLQRAARKRKGTQRRKEKPDGSATGRRSVESEKRRRGPRSIIKNHPSQKDGAKGRRGSDNRPRTTTTTTTLRGADFEWHSFRGDGSDHWGWSSISKSNFARRASRLSAWKAPSSP
jgi:hypothetical protein